MTKKPVTWGNRLGLALLVHPLERFEDIVHITRIRDNVMLACCNLPLQLALLEELAAVERLVYKVIRVRVANVGHADFII